MKLIQKLQKGNAIGTQPTTITNKFSYALPNDSSQIGTQFVTTNQKIPIAAQSAFRTAQKFKIFPENYKMSEFLKNAASNPASALPQNENVWYNPEIKGFEMKGTPTVQTSPQDITNAKILGKELPKGRYVGIGNRAIIGAGVK